MSGFARDGMPANLPGADWPARFIGGTASGAPTAGPYAAGDFEIDQSVPTVRVCTVAGSPGTWQPVADPALPWRPADNGLLVANGDPFAAANTFLLIAGTLYLCRLAIRQAVTISSLWWGVQTAGAGASTQSFTGLYNSSGTLLTGSSDIGTSMTATGGKQLTLTTPQAITAGTSVWAAIMTNLATTQPTLYRGVASNGGFIDLGQTTANYRFATNGAALTALPATLTLSSNATTGATFWVGGS